MALTLSAPSPLRQSLAALLPSFALPAVRPSAPARATPLQLEQSQETVSIWQTLQDLVPSIVWAVPKKQTTPRAKRLRSLNKHLKPKQHINHCPACGLPKLHGHICKTCLVSIRREFKNAARVTDFLAKQSAPPPAPSLEPPVRPKNYLETGNPTVEQQAKTAKKEAEERLTAFKAWEEAEEERKAAEANAPPAGSAGLS